MPEKGWFWYIPQHRDMISVGVVAEGKYLTRGGVREPEEIFKREIEQNAWIKAHLACGTPVGPYYLTSEFSWRSRYCAADGLLLAGDAFGFLDPVFSSGVMLALKSGSPGRGRHRRGFPGAGFLGGALRRLQPDDARGPRKHAQAGLCVL